MLHEDRRPEAEVRDYIDTWALSPPAVLDRFMGFLKSPLGRAYVVNYTAGAEIVAEFVGASRARYQRLLREAFTPADLISGEIAPSNARPLSRAHD
jgi:hypothetical protein